MVFIQRTGHVSNFSIEWLDTKSLERTMLHTPLRYPGGKAKFDPIIKQIIEQNNLKGHYVEPYAGGAGVALDLLSVGIAVRFISMI